MQYYTPETSSVFLKTPLHLGFITPSSAAPFPAATQLSFPQGTPGALRGGAMPVCAGRVWSAAGPRAEPATSALTPPEHSRGLLSALAPQRALLPSGRCHISVSEGQTQTPAGPVRNGPHAGPSRWPWKAPLTQFSAITPALPLSPPLGPACSA